MPEEKPTPKQLEEATDLAIETYGQSFKDEIWKGNVEKSWEAWNNDATHFLANICKCSIIPRGKFPMVIHQGMAKSSKDIGENKKVRLLGKINRQARQVIAQMQGAGSIDLNLVRNITKKLKIIGKSQSLGVTLTHGYRLLTK
jgi:hypothetical protein